MGFGVWHNERSRFWIGGAARKEEAPRPDCITELAFLYSVVSP